MKPGIFADLRSRGIYVSDEKYFQIKEPEINEEKSGFCGVSTSFSGSAKNLFDGNLKSAFSTKDKSSEENKNFSIKFKNNQITMYEYSIYTHCYPHSEVIVEGSNRDNEWIEIDHLRTAYSVNAYNYYNCEHPGTYQTIRFTIKGRNTGNSYRIHLDEIEIYGSIKRSCSCAIRKNTFNHFPFIAIFLVAS